jgi:hypothetical protein
MRPPRLLTASASQTRGPAMEPKDQQTLVLAVYKENCDQARHREVQRERVTAIVATTTGLLLGLFGFGHDAWSKPERIHLVIPVFLILLGLWGFAASWKHNERSSLHRQRIRQCRTQLEKLSAVNLAEIKEKADVAHGKEFGWKVELETRTHIIWKTFNLLVVALGLVVLGHVLTKLHG